MTEEDSYEKGMVGWREMKNVCGKGRKEPTIRVIVSLPFIFSRQERQTNISLFANEGGKNKARKLVMLTHQLAG